MIKIKCIRYNCRLLYNKIMDYFKKINQNGLCNTIIDSYLYRIDRICEFLVYLYSYNESLKNIIMIESHNDFDCNGGKIYSYLLNKGINKQYKIVWVIKDKRHVPDSLPENVTYVLDKIEKIKKYHYLNTAKVLLSDCDFLYSRQKNRFQFIVHMVDAHLKM